LSDDGTQDGEARLKGILKAAFERYQFVDAGQRPRCEAGSWGGTGRKSGVEPKRSQQGGIRRTPLLANSWLHRGLIPAVFESLSFYLVYTIRLLRAAPRWISGAALLLGA